MQKMTAIEMIWQLFITDGITTKRIEEERQNRDRFSYGDFIKLRPARESKGIQPRWRDRETVGESENKETKMTVNN
jgi:hypothetical protein